MSDTHRSEYEKQLAGEEFWNSDPEISAKKSYARDLCDQYNLPRESEPERRLELLQTLFGNCDDKIFIKPPFHCDFGYNIHVGKNFFANFDVVFLDTGKITIGDNCLIGMGATLLDNAVVPSGCIIAANALVLSNAKLEPNSVYAGVPAKKVKEVTPEQREEIIRRTAHDYMLYASWFKEDE